MSKLPNFLYFYRFDPAIFMQNIIFCYTTLLFGSWEMSILGIMKVDRPFGSSGRSALIKEGF
ncbi:hypothetical protein QUB60_05590 [Microcoleus sp. A2-C5]|uniref:hypothetical protein n=1 Tax=Microcoleus sp. A2-C2 TaxID=2818530 RepID=UPI002FD413B7